MSNPTFQMSADARLLVTHLRDATVGQEFTYDELSKVVSRKIGGGTGALQTALKRLLRDSDIVFGTMRGKGIKRLDDKSIVDAGTAVTNRIRRIAKRGFERLSKADFSTLPREYQSRFSAQASVMATIAHMSGNPQIAKLEQGIPSGKRELPVAETLKMFGAAP